MSELSITPYKENPEIIQNEAEKLYSKFQRFLSFNARNLELGKNVFASKSELTEIALRVDKRKWYYSVFHQLIQISEFKEIALYTFWIMKLKPFFTTDVTHKLADSLNEYYAIYLILSTIKGCCSERKVPYLHPCHEFIENAIYSFRFQDLSKEALMLFVETLAFAYGVYPISQQDDR